MCRAGSGELAGAGPDKEAGLEEERAGEREVADLAEAAPIGTDVLAHIQSRLRPVELYAVRFLEEVCLPAVQGPGPLSLELGLPGRLWGSWCQHLAAAASVPMSLQAEPRACEAAECWLVAGSTCQAPEIPRNGILLGSPAALGRSQLTSRLTVTAWCAQLHATLVTAATSVTMACALLEHSLAGSLHAASLTGLAACTLGVVLSAVGLCTHALERLWRVQGIGGPAALSCLVVRRIEAQWTWRLRDRRYTSSWAARTGTLRRSSARSWPRYQHWIMGLDSCDMSCQECAAW